MLSRSHVESVANTCRNLSVLSYTLQADIFALVVASYPDILTKDEQLWYLNRVVKHSKADLLREALDYLPKIEPTVCVELCQQSREIAMSEMLAKYIIRTSREGINHMYDVLEYLRVNNEHEMYISLVCLPDFIKNITDHSQLLRELVRWAAPNLHETLYTQLVECRLFDSYQFVGLLRMYAFDTPSMICVYKHLSKLDYLKGGADTI